MRRATATGGRPQRGAATLSGGDFGSPDLTLLPNDDDVMSHTTSRRVGGGHEERPAVCGALFRLSRGTRNEPLSISPICRTVSEGGPSTGIVGTPGGRLEDFYSPDLTLLPNSAASEYLEYVPVGDAAGATVPSGRRERGPVRPGRSTVGVVPDEELRRNFDLAQSSLARRRVEAALAGGFDERDLNAEERVVFNVELDTSISEAACTISFGEVLAGRGVTTVALDKHGQLTRYHSDGTTSPLE